jgi:hypothetical protein
MTNLAKHSIDKQIDAMQNLYPVKRMLKEMQLFLSTFNDYTKRIVFAGTLGAMMKEEKTYAV